MSFALKRVIAMGLTALTAGVLPTPATAEPGQASCRDVNISIPVGLLGQQNLYGRLCEPPVPTRTVLVLVPGATYNSAYWDLPSGLGLHSFRSGMNRAGYATLTVDRLGTGRSSRPLSVTLTTISQAGTIHRAVQALRSGSLGRSFDKVIVGGHSLGAAISIVEAANYQDVDAVLLAGIAHHLDPEDAASALLAVHPALLDPRFAGQAYDPGYLTTRPNTREQAFHNVGVATPEAVEHDENTKDVVATTEIADGVAGAVIGPYSILVNVPVLLALSSGDEIFCGPVPLATDCSSAEALRLQEAPYFPSRAQLETFLFPGNYGHSFNYAAHADQFYEIAAEWADRVVGR